MKSTAQQRAALVIATLAAFITPFMGSAVNIALPAIGAEFAIDAVLLNWISTSFILASAMFLVPMGRFADMHGRKRVFMAGMAIYTAASILAPLAGSASALIACRIAQGIGSAMTFGTGLPILISVFPPQRRGQVLGINVSAVYLGLSMGPFLGGLITQHLGWRFIFLATVPMGIVILILVPVYLKGEWAEARGERFDLAGSLVYGFGLAALMYGFSRLPSTAGILLAMAGAVALIAFYRIETSVASPVMNMALFRDNVVFALSNFAALINYSATFASGFLLSLYLQYIKAMTPESAGIVLVAQPVVMALLSPLAGSLSDRIEPRIVASIGMAFTTIGLASFIFVDTGTPLGLIVAGLVVLGLGFALFSSPNTNAVMSSVESRHYGVASGTLGTMRLTGQMFSMGIAMLIFALVMGRVPITPEHYGQYLASARIAFSIFTSLCFAGIFMSLARGKVR
ncbi:MAG: MFS transporter [Spirochaetes bacterium]|jgi:EmrB/QacA subfamily drug resistance transporter|nr:MFS transporter [Spirochaetota bacterium]